MGKAKRNFKEELLDLAAEAFAAAAAARADADARKAEAVALREKGLKLRRIAKMPEQLTGPRGSVGFRRAPKKFARRWPFQQALERRGWTVTDWVARQTGNTLGVSTARSWLKPSAHRPCPEFWAQKIADDFTPRDGRGRPTGPSEVPAVDASWPHGVRRK